MQQFNELWAKVNARERLVVYGAAVTAVAWLVGVILASKDLCGDLGGRSYGISCNYNFFTHYHGMDLGLLALIAAIAAVVVIYIHVAPNMNVTFPAPFPVILLGIAVAALVCTALMTLMMLTSGVGFGDWPIFAWVADLGMLAGGALMTWAAYTEWAPTRTVPPSA